MCQLSFNDIFPNSAVVTDSKGSHFCHFICSGSYYNLILSSIVWLLFVSIESLWPLMTSLSWRTLSQRPMSGMESWALKVWDWSWTTQHQVRRRREGLAPCYQPQYTVTPEGWSLYAAQPWQPVICVSSGGAGPWHRAVPRAEGFAPGGKHSGSWCCQGYRQGSGEQRPAPGTPLFKPGRRPVTVLPVLMCLVADYPSDIFQGTVSSVLFSFNKLLKCISVKC